MPAWVDFEIESTEYLHRTFGTYATFDHKGGRDANVSDIEVLTKTGKRFYIEAKHCPAQCGQFVLLPDIGTQTFVYSGQNATQINAYSAAIMKHMNEHFDAYKEAGTAGRDIDMENGPAIFASWIVQAYKDKGAKFIITNNNIVLPIESFAQYFSVVATYRVKRSGSSSVGKGRISVVENYLRANYPLSTVTASGDRLFAVSDRYLHNKRFVIDGTEYMISQRQDRYEIRRLSNTFNANVIFSIDLKPGVRGLSNSEFISFLR